MENLEKLFEVFDTKSDNLYPIVNMKPGSSTPQIFLIKNGGDENLIVRLMALSDKGDTVRVLKSTDKNVIVEIMAINDRGRHVVLKNGLGPDAIKTIVTIFDTTLNVLNLQIVDSIMFRFQTNKLKGQSKSVSRILEKLCMTRGKGRFVPLKEMKQFTNKFSYVVLHKKRLDIDELPGAKNISDKYTKTKKGSLDVYVDSNGKEISKSEIVADAIVSTVDQIKHEQIVQKTKIDRKALVNALYSRVADRVEDWSENAQKAYEEINETSSIYRGRPDEKTKLFNNNLERKLLDDDFSYRSTYERIQLSGGIEDEKLAMEILEKLMNEVRKMSHTSTFPQIDNMISICKEYKVENIPEIIKACVYVISAKFADILVDNTYDYGFTAKEREVVNAYSDTSYSAINSFLIGNSKKVVEYTYETSVKNLDSAFKKGVTLPETTVLYRGMEMAKYELDQLMKHKTFIFKNYVSTSLSPIIFTTMFGNAGTAYISDEKKLDDEKFEYKVGFIIRGADKVKSIIPGKHAEHPRECEVILPRGLMIQINDFKFKDEAVLCECEVVLDEDYINEKQIENETSTHSFANVYFEKEEQKPKIKNMDVLLELFAGSKISEKFMM